MLVVQIATPAGPRAALLEGGLCHPARDATVLDLAQRAIDAGAGLAAAVEDAARGPAVALETVTLLPPVTHPDPAHLHATGTGLTHLGSADARDRMHAAAGAEVTDSIRMFRDGMAGGRPAPGSVGAQPEWFYKGNGHAMAAPGGDLSMPPFAEDGGEEPELAGLYLIGPDGTPHTLGFALANEFSDHVTERRNYLLLAHSKLRAFSVGPALRLGPPPADIRGTSRVLRSGREVFAGAFLTGEANMSHTLANLEHHHFKYDLFRRPGDVHVHMFGTACLSFAAGVATEPGDVFEIAAPGFGPPLVNRLVRAPGDPAVPVAARPL
jgi:hypothetical protein